MEGATEFFTSFYWLYLPQLMLESFWYADWEGAYRRDGIVGLCTEALRSIAGTNSYPFFVPMNGGWSGRDIQRLLAKYGIKMWGWAFANRTLFFHVKRSQAAWAQYVMLRAGVPLQPPLLGEEPTANSIVGNTTTHDSQPSHDTKNGTDTDYRQQFNKLRDAIESILAQF